MTRQLRATVFFFFLSLRRQRRSRSRSFWRRLITLIFAGRNRIIVIRRELPRTIGAGSVRRPTASNLRGFSFSCTPRPLPTLPPLHFSLQNKFTLCRPLQRLLLRCFYLDPDGPDKTQQLAAYRRHYDSLVLALGQQLSIPLM